MKRPDGKRVKGLSYFDLMIPHIMNKRLDASNYAKQEIDVTRLLDYLRELKSQGHNIGLMESILTAFSHTVKKYPELNRFVVNKRIYLRNHHCVSFIVIRQSKGMDIKETAVKVFFTPGDTLFKISEQMRETIEQNRPKDSENAADKLVNKIMAFSLIPGAAVSIIKLMDRHGLLPRKIIDVSPFHTTLFVTNMASLNMDYIYHHLYEFGTTTMFVSIGRPRKVFDNSGAARRVMTLGFTLDERICPGAAYAKCFIDLKKILEHPEKYLVNGLPDQNAELAAKA